MILPQSEMQFLKLWASITRRSLNIQGFSNDAMGETNGECDPRLYCVTWELSLQDIKECGEPRAGWIEYAAGSSFWSLEHGKFYSLEELFGKGLHELHS